jgi:hypothetical protein
MQFQLKSKDYDLGGIKMETQTEKKVKTFFVYDDKAKAFAEHYFDSDRLMKKEDGKIFDREKVVIADGDLGTSHSMMSQIVLPSSLDIQLGCCIPRAPEWKDLGLKKAVSSSLNSRPEDGRYLAISEDFICENTGIDSRDIAGLVYSIIPVRYNIGGISLLARGFSIDGEKKPVFIQQIRQWYVPEKDDSTIVEAVLAERKVSCEKEYKDNFNFKRVLLPSDIIFDGKPEFYRPKEGAKSLPEMLAQMQEHYSKHRLLLIGDEVSSTVEGRRESFSYISGIPVAPVKLRGE